MVPFGWKCSVLLTVAVAFIVGPGTLAAQSRIGGSQTSNTHVAADDTSTTTANTSPSGAAHAAVKSHAAATPAAPVHESIAPLNTTLPTDPNTPIEVSEAGLKTLVLHKEPAVYPELARRVHAKGAIVLDVVIDQQGNVQTADPIGAEDLAGACMDAISLWKFKPYIYKGQPWKMRGPVRFLFLNPAKGTAESCAEQALCRRGQLQLLAVVLVEKRRKVGAAASFIQTRGSNDDELLRLSQPLRVNRALAAHHANGRKLGHLVGHSHEVGHGTERLGGEGHVEPGGEHALAERDQLRRKGHNGP